MLDGAEAPMNQFDVHPAAAVFPMMSEDELNDLAADIEAHGLLHPIVLDHDGQVVIDGRNRLEACYRAGVEPQFRRLNGEDDHLAFIASANLNRRNLTKGQKAMALAMIYPEPERGRGKKDEALGKLPENGGFKRERLRQARSVLRHSMALAEDVMSGRTALDAALANVQREREAAVSAEAQLSALSQYAPDLAEMVEDEKLSLGEAYAVLRKREEDAAKVEDNKREGMLRLSEGAWNMTTAWSSPDFVAELRERLEDDAFREQWLARMRCDKERIAEVQAGAAAFGELLEEVLADV